VTVPLTAGPRDGVADTSRPERRRLRTQRPFVAILTGQTLSQFGDYAFRIALPIEALRLTGSGRLLSAVLVAQSISLVLAALAGGVLADRAGSRRVMFLTDAGRGVVVCAATVAIATGRITPWALVVVALMLGVGQGLFQPAYQAAVPELVPAGQLTDAARAGALWRRLASLGGVPAGGALVAAFGTSWGFALNGATFVVAAACVGLSGRWPGQLVADRSARRGPLADFVAGLRYVGSRRDLEWPIAAFGVAVLTTFSPLFLALPLLLAPDGRAGTLQFSLVLTVAAVGGVSGSGAYRHVARSHPRGRVAMTALAVVGLSYAALAVAHPDVVWMTAAAFVAGAATTVGDVAWSSALQAHVPREVLGRVSSVDWVASFGLAPVGYALLPLALLYGSPRAVILCGGLVTAAFALAVGALRAVRSLT